MSSTIITQQPSCAEVKTRRPKGVLSWLVQLDAAYRQRRKLAAMSDEKLRDIGLTRTQADQAAKTVIWDPPIQFR